uniref:Uncharacterized protein n=1 Tax=viral metagenome TaxID=1070528 RepID=A0A6C0LBX1_9ZZZZ
MENNINIEDIFKGLLTGFFASYLIILGMRPAAIYPDNILDIIDNPWIFLILFIINYYVLSWDITIGLLLFLTLIALILDIIIFTDGDFLKDNMITLNNTIYNLGNEDNKEITSVREAIPAKGSGSGLTTEKSYKDINDIILGKLIYYNKMAEDTDTITPLKI